MKILRLAPARAGAFAAFRHLRRKFRTSSGQVGAGSEGLVRERSLPDQDAGGEYLGLVVDNHLSVDLDIDTDGTATVRYEHQLHNLTATPLTGLARQFWFKHTHSPLNLEQVPGNERSILVRRVHDVGVHVNFACQVFPAIQPGDAGRIAYVCTGGVFDDELYWRQSIYRPTKRLCLTIRLHGAPTLTACSAVEERADGSQTSAAETLVWHRDETGTVISLTRDDLVANQSVTLRWGVLRAGS